MMSVMAERGRRVVFVPKNRGLRDRVARIDGYLPGGDDVQHCEVRGEDVPQLASEAARSFRAVFAVTGEDLLEEWLAAGNALDPALVRGRIAWNQDDALFGRPSLCLIGPDGRALTRERCRVAICARYANLAERTLRPLERSLGFTFRRSYMQGALETVLEHDLADAIVDIVVTGRTIRRFDLSVLDVLFQSDLATLETP